MRKTPDFYLYNIANLMSTGEIVTRSSYNWFMIPLWLLFNHADAWSMTFIIAVLSLSLRGAMNGDTLIIPIALALGAWFAFAINDRFDAPFDAQDAAKARRNVFARYFPAGSQTLRPFDKWTPLDPILLGAFSALGLMYLGFGWRGLLAGLAGWAAAWAYSAPPLRLKTRPFWDLITHAAFVETFPYLAAIWLAGAWLTPFDALAWGILALASLSAQLEQQARDFALDSRFERNFTTHVGLTISHRLLGIASVLLLLAGVFGAASGLIPPFVWAGMAMTIPMILHRLLRPAGTPRSERLIWLSMLAGVLYIVVIIGLMI